MAKSRRTVAEGTSSPQQPSRERDETPSPQQRAEHTATRTAAAAAGSSPSLSTAAACCCIRESLDHDQQSRPAAAALLQRGGGGGVERPEESQQPREEDPLPGGGPSRPQLTSPAGPDHSLSSATCRKGGEDSSCRRTRFNTSSPSSTPSP